MNCTVCGGILKLLGTVPFDRNNQEVAIVDDTPMEYYRCESCDFLCCPEMLSWTPQDLGNRVYNKDYVIYDPDYLGPRPKNYAQFLKNNVNKAKLKSIKHLDYGSGEGILTQELSKSRWNSSFYDPYSSPVKPAGVYNFITAIEVFEHALNIDETIKDIKSMLDSRNGVILFSTLFADKNTDIDWWYIGARNGHISILSEKSMKILAIRNNLFFSSIGTGMHVLQTTRNSLKDVFAG